MRVANYLRNDILEYCSSLSNLNWPPSIDELTKEDRLPPTSVTLFLTNLLKSADHSLKPYVQRLIDSYSLDMIHGVSRGSVITSKHFLLGLGLHNITGQKKVVQLANRFGHSISYDKVCDIELAQALKAQTLAEENTGLPLKPATESDTVLTVFWVDNFDMNVETQTGGGAINITTMMAFQEVSENSVPMESNITINKKSQSALLLKNKTTVNNISIHDKKEPTSIPFQSFKTNIEEAKFLPKYFL